MDSITLHIPQSKFWSKEELLEFCSVNRDLRIERNKDGGLIISPPAGGISSICSAIINSELYQWNKTEKKGIVLGSKAGFLLSENSMRSPKSSFLTMSKWNSLSEIEKNQLLPICPDFIIEVRSFTDKLPMLQKKMEAWIKNGVQLAWLIDPLNPLVKIYRAGKQTTSINSFSSVLSGENILSGFEFDLMLLTNN